MDQIPTVNTDYSWVKDNNIEHIFMIMYLQYSRVVFQRTICLVNTETLFSSDSDKDINICKKPICSFWETTDLPGNSSCSS